MKILSIIAWLPVIVIKFVLIIMGLIIVPFYMGVLKKNPPGLWRHGMGRPYTVWEAAIRNPVGGFDHLIIHPMEYKVITNLAQHPINGFDNIEMEAIPMIKAGQKFAWRFRYAGILSSLRLVWLYPGKYVSHYGELYIGWKLGSNPPLLDFALSFRPWARVGK